MEKQYTITLTEYQLRILSNVCDRYSRLICGQLDLSLQEVCEEAWCRDHKTDEHPHGIGSNEWYEMRRNLEEKLKEMEETYWGLTGGRYYGIGYDKTADLLFDMRKAMEYALWDNMEPAEKERMRFTVMSDGPMGLTEHPLIEVKLKKEQRSSPQGGLLC